MSTPSAQEEHFDLVATAIGPIGLAWSSLGLTRLRLPEEDPARTATRLRGSAERADVTAAPPFVAQAAELLRRYADGVAVDFASLPLDLARRSPFERGVYREALNIPHGRTSTYGAIAHALGDPTQARAVGQALGRNPLAIIVPCHRVLAAGGKPGGFSAYGGRVTKARLLALEGVTLPGFEPTLPGLDLPIRTARR